MTSRIFISSFVLILGTMASLVLAKHHNKKTELGYRDTPFIPGKKWRVHDGTRPQPRIVTPATTFSHSAPPPSDATILFDGRDLLNFEKSDGQPAAWKVENGYAEVVPGSGSIQTKEHFGDFHLHLEFATPHQVEGESQGRGNSGVIMFPKYEVQILDSFQNPTYPDGQAGALYGQLPPRVNASMPPGAWQSYDIIFESARWDEETLIKKAKVTVIHNGVVLHHGQEFSGLTSHRRVGSYAKPHPPQGPIQFQDHNNPMRFRNIWIRELGEYDK